MKLDQLIQRKIVPQAKEPKPGSFGRAQYKKKGTEWIKQSMELCEL